MRYLLFCALFCILSLSAHEYKAKDYSHLTEMEGFHKELIQMHLKLYQGYVKNTNSLIKQLAKTSPSSYEFGALKRRFGWEFDGMYLHELYFENLGGLGQVNSKSALHKAITAQWGSFAKWKEEFVGVGLMRGIGWAALCYDEKSGRLFNIWINEHDTGQLSLTRLLLIMDVFEHAFITQWGLDRKGYIEAFFAKLNWNTVESRFTLASSRE